MLASVNDDHSQARPSPGHYASCFCYEGCSSGEALPLDGGGLGGGDAALLAGDRLMHAVAATRSCWPPSISTINRAS